jgi:hypothetical protein
MERKAYPTYENGMPVHVSELGLRRSHLPDTPENKSLHHLHFTAPRMSKLLITQTVRDLEHEQEFTQNDQHNLGRFALHHLYDPPRPASLIQYMDRLDVARELGEEMRVRANGRWVLQQISGVHWLQIQQEYNREKG